MSKRHLEAAAIAIALFGMFLFGRVSHGQDKPKQCDKGQYLTMDGRCLHDQTGESHPAGDGCNVSTCMDPACRMSSTTLMYCSHPDDPAPIQSPPITGSVITGDLSPTFSSGVMSIDTGCPHGYTYDGDCYVGQLLPDVYGILIIDGAGDVVGVCHHVSDIRKCKPKKPHTRKEMIDTYLAIEGQLERELGK